MKLRTALSVMALCILIMGAAAHGEALTVRVTQVKGSVQVKKPGAASFSAVKSAQQVGRGYVVKTGGDGSCILKWDSGHSVKISPMSMVSVDQAEKTGGGENSTINIQNGKVFAKVEKLSTGKSDFKIKTPTAIAGVRGSEILVEVTEDSSSFQVVEGSFDIANEAVALVLDQNFEVEIGDVNETVEAAPIPPEDLNGILMEVEEIKGEIMSADTELMNMSGEELKEIDQDEPLEESTGEQGMMDVEGESEPAADAEAGDALISDITDIVDQQTVTDPNADAAFEFEPGYGGVELIIE